MMARRSSMTLLMAATVTSSGCSSLYPTEPRGPRATFAMSVRWELERPPLATSDVRRAESFADARASWHRVAVRMPETCADRAVSAACSLVQSQIERGLAQKLAVASTSGASALTAAGARELGIDVLLVVDGVGMEAGTRRAEAKEHVDVVALDEAAAPASAPASVIEAARAIAKDRSADLRERVEKSPPDVVVTLDVTAVDTRTGDAVWFYRGREVSATRVVVGRRFAFAYEGETVWPIAKGKGASSAAPAAPPPSDDGARADLAARRVVEDMLTKLGGAS